MMQREQANSEQGEPTACAHQMVTPKAVGKGFKILASLSLRAFALKVFCFDSAQMG